jgi:hypothetical protein
MKAIRWASCLRTVDRDLNAPYSRMVVAVYTIDNVLTLDYIRAKPLLWI